MAMTRAAAPVAAFTPAVRAPRRAQRVQMRVAAMEPPAAAEAEAAEPEVSSEELYRRFEEMIAQHDMAYSVGDRVRRAAAMCGAGARTCLPALPCRRRPPLPLPAQFPAQGSSCCAPVACIHLIQECKSTTNQPSTVVVSLGLAMLCMPHACAPAATRRRRLIRSRQVQGTVVRVDQRGAYVDIGGKSTAFCPTVELALANIPRVSRNRHRLRPLVWPPVGAPRPPAARPALPERQHRAAHAAPPQLSWRAAWCTASGSSLRLGAGRVRVAAGCPPAVAAPRATCTAARPLTARPRPAPVCCRAPRWWAPTPCATLWLSARSGRAT